LDPEPLPGDGRNAAQARASHVADLAEFHTIEQSQLLTTIIPNVIRHRS
jgi:hypothetical protein